MHHIDLHLWIRFPSHHECWLAALWSTECEDRQDGWMDVLISTRVCRWAEQLKLLFHCTTGQQKVRFGDLLYVIRLLPAASQAENATGLIPFKLERVYEKNQLISERESFQTELIHFSDCFPHLILTLWLRLCWVYTLWRIVDKYVDWQFGIFLNWTLAQLTEGRTDMSNWLSEWDSHSHLCLMCVSSRVWHLSDDFLRLSESHTV